MNRKIVVLKHLARGVHIKEIALMMGCSRYAINGLLYRMRKVMRCRNNTELVVGAIMSGIIEMPEEYELVNLFRLKELRERRKVA